MDKRAEALRGFGFRFGNVGTHARRTMMYAELATLIGGTPDADKSEYMASIIDHNVLTKRTVATRRGTAQYLTELYGLDPSIPLFRVFRLLWLSNVRGRPLLALICAAARDPILRSSQGTITVMAEGTILSKQGLERAVESTFPGRFNATTLASITRNLASSWTQSGYLTGKVRKQRTHPETTPENVTLAFLLSYAAGRRGQSLFDSEWTKLLDLSQNDLAQTVREASRRGLIDFRGSGAVVDIKFDSLLTSRELEILHGKN